MFFVYQFNLISPSSFVFWTSSYYCPA